MSTPQEHPFLTAVRFAAQMGAPYFYADPDMAEPVVVLPLRQYQALLSAEGEGGPSPKPPLPPVVSEVRPPTSRPVALAPEFDAEAAFDPQAVERVIAQGERDFAKNPGNSGVWQPIAARSGGVMSEEEGFYLHPVPRVSGL